MKQNISVEDLNELSEEQKEKLRKMWEPKQYDVVYVHWMEVQQFATGIILNVNILENGYWDLQVYSNETLRGFRPKQYLLPILSIGQMIEILINNNEFFNISNVYVKHPTTSDRSINNGYGIWLHKLSKEYRADELCNALWLAVKNIL